MRKASAAFSVAPRNKTRPRNGCSGAEGSALENLLEPQVTPPPAQDPTISHTRLPAPLPRGPQSWEGPRRRLPLTPPHR